MKSLETLRSRMTDKDTLMVQNEDGFVGEMGFEWRTPATESELQIFEKTNNISLPHSFRDFLKITNGAVLFKDIKYGQWGCNIMGINDLIKTSTQVKDWGYSLKSNWIVFATWLGVFSLK